MAWPKKNAVPAVTGIMQKWQAVQPKTAPPMPGSPTPNPKQKVAVVLAEKKRNTGGVPGLMSARNDLANMRRDTMPKGHQYGK